MLSITKMRVLLVSPLGDQLNGGIAKWTDHIITYYKSLDSDLELTLLNNPNSKAGFGTDSILRRIRNGIQNYYPLYKSFKTITKQAHFDVVHVCTSASFSLVKDFAIVKHARKKGIKSIVHCHFGRIPKILKATDWEHKLFIKLMHIVDQLVVMDMQSYKALSDYGYEKVSYLPNPLAVSVQQLIEENNDIQRLPNKIVFAGHLVKAKGVYELVEACKQLKGIELEMLGHIPSEEVKDQLIELSEDPTGGWLHIKGARPFEEVIKEMCSCGVFALPSYSEGFPNVIIESMACGCPIVTTPVGAIPEMLNIDNASPCGICVEPQNVEQLRNAIARLLENKDMAVHYGERAKNRVREMYVMPIVWEQLTEIWNRTLKWPSRGK